MTEISMQSRNMIQTPYKSNHKNYWCFSGIKIMDIALYLQDLNIPTSIVHVVGKIKKINTFY